MGWFPDQTPRNPPALGCHTRMRLNEQTDEMVNKVVYFISVEDRHGRRGTAVVAQSSSY
jgi:hypothetical protein